MKLFARLVAVVGAISAPGLAVAWCAGAAGAQGAHHEAHPSASLLSPELLAGMAHGVTQGAVVFLAGLVAFAALVWIPANRAEDGEGGKDLPLLCRWTWVLAGGLVVVGMVELPVYAVRASGETLSPGLVGEALLDTRTGHLWIERVALGVVVAAAATYAARRPLSAYRWAAALVAGALLLMTLTRQSHAAAEGGVLPFAADWLHVVAASLWMGGLLGFAILLVGPLRAGPAEARARVIVRTVRRFSKAATIAVMVLIATGLYAVLLHVPSVEELLSTPYGRALTIKMGLAVFLFAAGAMNLTLQGRGPFSHLVGAELVLAIGVFVATGFLTSLPPADVPQPTPEEQETAQLERLRPPTVADVPNAAAQPANNAVVRAPGTPYSETHGGPP